MLLTAPIAPWIVVRIAVVHLKCVLRESRMPDVSEEKEGKNHMRQEQLDYVRNALDYIKGAHLRAVFRNVYKGLGY